MTCICYCFRREYVAKTPAVDLLCSRPTHEPELCINPDEQVIEVSEFKPNLCYMIQATYDDGESWFFTKALNLVRDLTTRCQAPPVDLLHKVLFEVLMRSETVCVINKAYHLMESVTRTHPPVNSLPFTWQHIDETMSVVSLERSVGTQRGLCLLQYMVNTLEKHLLHRTITKQRQVMSSMVYQWLCSHDKNACKIVHAMIRWMSEYTELHAAFNKLTINDQSQDLHIPKVFPLLDKLLDLAVVVCDEPNRFTETIANELCVEYQHLPDLAHKTFLLQHLSHSLLRLKLITRVLCYCDTVDGAAQLRDVSSLQDIVDGPFKACPPKNNTLTPPASPSTETVKNHSG